MLNHGNFKAHIVHDATVQFYTKKYQNRNTKSNKKKLKKEKHRMCLYTSYMHTVLSKTI